MGIQLKDLKSSLALHPDSLPRFIMPNRDQVPAHFHITEVGHVAKRFIDCGGTLHDTTHTCLLQLHVADDVEHRMNAGTFAKILQLGGRVLPHDDLPVEVEYDCCVVAHFPIASATFASRYVNLQLGESHTACRAKAKCGSGDSGCGGHNAKTTGRSAEMACC